MENHHKAVVSCLEHFTVCFVLQRRALFSFLFMCCNKQVANPLARQLNSQRCILIWDGVKCVCAPTSPLHLASSLHAKWCLMLWVCANAGVFVCVFLSNATGCTHSDWLAAHWKPPLEARPIVVTARLQRQCSYTCKTLVDLRRDCIAQYTPFEKISGRNPVQMKIIN